MLFEHSPKIANSSASFVGRERDLERLAELVSKGVRLITIRGPAGVGKTRLATRFAALDHSDDGFGAWFCSLTEAQTAEEICAAVADALEATLETGDTSGDLVTQLGRAISARGPLLLVIDNAEQVIEQTAQVISRWSRLAPDAQILVTSREPLALHDETVLDLQPLDSPPRELVDPERIYEYAAIRLFVDRAENADSSFAPLPKDAPVIAEIVRKLDGLPLAIELAAAYASVLSPPALLARLERRFEVLETTQRDICPRQRTMWAAVDWSWQLLSDVERKTLARCAAFSGGFSLAAAEAVTGESGPNIVRVLKLLRDKSMVRAGNVAADDGERRFGLYESVREYALGRLRDFGDEEAVRSRHADYYLQRSWDWLADIRGPRRGADLERIRCDFDNLTAAFEWILGSALDRQGADRAVRAALSLHIGISTRGSLFEASAVLDRAIETVEQSDGDKLLLALALRSRGIAQRRRENLTASRDDLERAIRLAREVGHRDLEGTILCSLARAEAAAGRAQAAADCLDVVLGIAESIGSRQLRAEGVTHRAVLHRQSREFSTAMALLDEVLVEARELSDRWMEGRILGNMCSIAIEQSMDIRLPELLRQALAVYDLLGNQRSRALLETHLSIYFAARGDFDRARRNLERAAEAFRAMGDRPHEIAAVRTLGWVDLREHGPSGGLEHFDEVLRLLTDDEVTASDGYTQAARGLILASRDELERAEQAFGAARAWARLTADAAEALIIHTSLGHLELAQARKALRTGNRDAADKLVAVARRRLADAREDRLALGGETRVAFRLGIDAAVRLLDHAIRDQTSRPARRFARGSTPPAELPPDDALIVDHAGAWFRAPGGDLVDLQRRKPMRCILHELVRMRLSTPGEALPVETLVEIGWPGERVLPSAGASRVHVAIGSLRKLGLRDVLLRDKTGYLLDPRVPLLDDYQRTTVLAPTSQQ